MDSARPPWARRHHGWIIGVNWRLGSEIGGPGSPRWGVVWNSTTGEVVAVQILADGLEAGEVVTLGWVPRPTRLGPAIPKLISEAHANGLLSLAVLIQVTAADAVHEQLLGVIDRELRESAGSLPVGESR